jgi:ribosomal protein RSM22 (predicted rRNA methylase)
VDTVPEEALWSVVGDVALPTLHRAIIERSRRYTSERDRLGARPTDPAADLAARALFFTLCDAPKIAIPLAELANRGLLPSRPLRIVDVGAGCGALSIGIAAFVKDRSLDFTLLDRDTDALAIGKRALARIAPGANVVTRGLDLARDAALPPADFVVLGNVLNELPPAARLPLITRALAAIADDGAVIIIEPALRETARALHELRDAVLAAQLAHVFAPCTRTIAPCPMLADERDWCHEDRAVTLPPRTAELARVTHLRDDGLKFSYLVLRRAPAPLVDADHAWRVVSAVHAPKGKVELDGCSDAGLVQLRLLRRHRSDANRAFERAVRGDVVIVDGAEVTTATRVEPAKR